MAIHILAGKDNSALTKSESKVQSIPCKIFTDEEAKISKYFEPYVRTTDENVLTGSFRGYPLKGQNIQLPENYVGVVLEEKSKPQTDKEDRRFYVTRNFRSFISWNWDKNPSKNDKIMQALDWIEIAEALHSPIVEE